MGPWKQGLYSILLSSLDCPHNNIIPFEQSRANKNRAIPHHTSVSHSTSQHFISAHHISHTSVPSSSHPRSLKMAPRRSTRIASKTTTTTTENASTSTTQPSHRTADQPDSIIRQTSVPLLRPTNANHAHSAIALLSKEYEAIIGMAQLARGVEPYVSRAQELAHLAHLAVEDPVGHYYAQSAAERAPCQLQAAGVLFQLSGGNVAEPVAALTMMKAAREDGKHVGVGRKAVLVGAWRVSFSPRPVCRISAERTMLMSVL